MKNPIKILLVEDHQLVREAWNLMLSSYSDFKIIGEIDNLDNLEAGLHQYRPDIILLDLNIKGQLSIDYVPIICGILPNPKIIIVSMNSECYVIKKMFSLGVKGYISKNSSSKDLIEGIRKIYDGEVYTSPDVTRLLTENSLSDLNTLKLSVKDISIIKQISEGASNKDIAAAENVSEKTVESRKTKIFKKVNVKNSPELVTFALKNGLV